MENDKTAGWLVIITFLAFALAIMFGLFEYKELSADDQFQNTELFSK